MQQTKYTPWKVQVINQLPNMGSKPYYGNFHLGLIVDSHPRFINVIFGLLFFEIGICFSREAIIHETISAVDAEAAGEAR